MKMYLAIQGPNRPDLPATCRALSHCIVEAAIWDNKRAVTTCALGDCVTKALWDIPAIPHPVWIREGFPAGHEFASQAKDAGEWAI